MTKMKSAIAALLTLSTCIISTASADSFDLALSNKTAMLTYESAGGITNKSMVKGSYFHHDDGDDAFDMSFLVGEVHKKSKLLIGGKVFYLNLDNASEDDGYGLAIGAEGAFTLAPKLSLKAHAYFAPEVTSFSDIEDYRDLEVRLAYDIIPEASVAFGYRSAKAELENGGSERLQDNLFLALTLVF